MPLIGNNKKKEIYAELGSTQLIKKNVKKGKKKEKKLLHRDILNDLGFTVSIIILQVIKQADNSKRRPWD